ncbi:MAG: Hsp70 family protein [Armatimonadota bacterium]
MAFSIGIDLGTTNSAVAYIDQHGMPQMVKNDSGDPTTPSAVYFKSEDEIVVGLEAKEALAFEPDHVAMFFKRNMGSASFCPQYLGRLYDATSLSREVLAYLNKTAIMQLGEVGEVIVTVPAYFHNPQREATIAAGKAAGLNIIRTINEPTAAAVAYSQRHPDITGRFLVYDLGGGTFDVTILEYTIDTTKVIASDGNHLLGGILWDERLLDYVANAFADEYGVNPAEDPLLVGDLRLRCEEAKKTLSMRDETKLSISYQGKRGAIPVTRTTFEDITSDLMDQTRVLMMQALKAAGLRWPDIDAVLLVGGSTRMPSVRTMISTLSRKEPLSDINPDECVAIGAALEAAATISAKQNRTFYLSGGLQMRKTQDVTPHSLGYVAISPDGRRFINDVIIRRNMPTPTLQANTAELDTSPNADSSLDLFLLQGERERILENEVLGHYEVTDIPLHSGKARLEIGFEYDTSGVVRVSCKDIKSGTLLPVRVTDRNIDLSWTDMSPKEYAEKMAKAYVVLLIDTSGSMSGTGIEEAKRAAAEFLTKLPKGKQVEVGIVEFGRSSGGILHKLSTDYSAINGVIAQLSASNGTPLTEGLSTCSQMLANIKDARTVVVLTDGMPNNVPGSLQMADSLKQAGVRIIAVGAGSGVDYDFLRRLASNPTDGMSINFTELTNTFGRIARAIGSSATGGLSLRGLSK